MVAFVPKKKKRLEGRGGKNLSAFRAQLLKECCARGKADGISR